VVGVVGIGHPSAVHQLNETPFEQLTAAFEQVLAGRGEPQATPVPAGRVRLGSQ